MDHKTEVSEFLTTRRARLTPAAAGLPAWGGQHRRVPGLRREEVAMLAGVSSDYYTRLERGNLSGASESVLVALADALQLDEPERAHLRDLAALANRSTSTRPRKPARQTVRPELLRVLDAIGGAPAFVINHRRDLLARNPLGRALYSEVWTETVQPPNTARFTFLNPRARTFFVDWELAAATLVGNLRSVVGRNPYDTVLEGLVGELSTRSEEFARLWASHDVRFHTVGLKSLRHPVVGELHLSYESMELAADPGLTLVVYTAEPSSVSADNLALLASWVATQAGNPEQAVGTSHGTAGDGTRRDARP